MDKFILLGHIVSAHGINGAVKIRSYTEPAKNIFTYKLFCQNTQIVELEYSFTKLPNFICKINSINNRTEVENLIGLKIFTDRESFQETENEDEYYITDLLNLPVLDENNNELGKIGNILNYGAGDLVEIKFSDGSSEILKFTKKNFPIVNKEYLILDSSFKNNE